jgi:hypothetical protein
MLSFAFISSHTECLGADAKHNETQHKNTVYLVSLC